MSIRITDRDRGLQALAARLAPKAQVRVGILADAPKETKDGEPTSASLIEIAGYHEFGAPDAGIPQRSFIRATLDEKGPEIHQALVSQARLVALGKLDIVNALHRVGAFVAGQMKARISAGIEPPLDPATVAKKGSSKPLINTGQLRSSITWIVELVKR